ncbi:MAG: hypothetical protein KF696_07450 [Planctomycetes bacterium]|nr:hypothetical protein [Planctomycetota bacterium]MCW8135386.1 hypothetical protein [Planctomycetota bacterium]
MSEHDNDDGPVEGNKTSVSTLPCTGCGADLEYKPGAREMKCGYCGHTQVIAVREGAAVIEYDLNDAFARYLGHAQHVQTTGQREVKCQDCGADIIVAAGAQTARCDYCGGKRIVEEELPPGVLQPESLLPFNFKPADAVDKFRKWLSGGDGFWGKLWVKLVRPGALQQRANVDDLHGVYVPFWTYDTQSHSSWTAQAGYYYYVTQSYTDSQGRRQTRQVRKIRWVWTSGQRRDFFDDWLVCASKQYYGTPLEALLEKIEPFPTKQLVPYDSKYLAGFRAERYSIDLKQGWNIAERGIRDECRSRCARDVPGDTHRFLSVNTNFWGQSFKYALLPVYIMSYRFKDKPYNVLVNGSTGLVKGGAPLSWIKVTILGIVIAAIIAAIVALVMIFGGDSQQAPSRHDQSPAVNHTTGGVQTGFAGQYDLPINVGDESWQVQWTFTGADESARRANWQNFVANHESTARRELEAVILAGPRTDTGALSRKAQQRLDTLLRHDDGTPRVANVRVYRAR